MLTMPSGSSSVVSIVGIDPGTEHLGVGIIRIDIQTLQIVLTYARTFIGSKMSKEAWGKELHGDRLGRIAAHRDNLLRIFHLEQPLAIAIESPFYSQRHPQAFGALTEVVCAAREAVTLYDPWKALYQIDPPTVKKAVGAAGNAGKEEVKAQLLQLPGLQYAGQVPLAALDEHSIDAIAVAYSRYTTLLEQLCLR